MFSWRQDITTAGPATFLPVTSQPQVTESGWTGASFSNGGYVSMPISVPGDLLPQARAEAAEWLTKLLEKRKVVSLSLLLEEWNRASLAHGGIGLVVKLKPSELIELAEQMGFFQGFLKLPPEHPAA